MSDFPMISEYLERILSSKKTKYFLGDARETLTRKESRDLIDKISHTLHHHLSGNEGQAKIAIYLPRNNFFLASIFAIWQNGHYYIPLNKTWPD